MKDNKSTARARLIMTRIVSEKIPQAGDGLFQKNSAYYALALWRTLEAEKLIVQLSGIESK